MSLLLELGEGVRAELLEPALGALVRQHDALRLRYRRGAEGWRQGHAGGGWGLRLEGRGGGGGGVGGGGGGGRRSVGVGRGAPRRPARARGPRGPPPVFLVPPP